MISRRLPATPRQSLSISGALRLAVDTVFRFADIFGFWKYPWRKAAADFEEMSLLHKIYWAYKSQKPITRAEKGFDLGTFFTDQDTHLRLPEGFLKETALTLSAVGDLIKVDGLEHSRDLLYEKVAPFIFAADISYGNLESQLTTQAIKDIVFNKNEGPPLCCTIDQFNALKGHKGTNFTVLHTACNHTLDMGLDGLETTLDRLEREGIQAIGTNRQEDDREKGCIIDKKGIKIGFVSATFGLNGKTIPPGKDYLVNRVRFHQPAPASDLSLIEKQIVYCRQQGCDFVIASLHWGYEYEFFPRAHQIEIAHTIVETGADLIISHHSHVIQPIEYYRPQRDPGRTAVIAYSLGNLTTSFSAPHLVLSEILRLTISRGTAAGKPKTYLEQVEVIPVVQVEVQVNGLPVIQVQPLDKLLEKVNKSGTPGEKSYFARVGEYAHLVLPEKKNAR